MQINTELKEIIGKEMMFFDGGMGSLLMREGLGRKENPADWNLLHPEKVMAIHRKYLEAGTDFITANTFTVNRFNFEDSSRAAELIRAGIRNAKKTAEEEESRRAGLVREGKAVYGPGFREHVYTVLDIGPLGRFLYPVGDLAFEDAVEAFKEIVRIGADAGADAVLIETFIDNYEMKAALLAAKEACDLPVFVTMTLSEFGRLLTGGDISSAVALLEGLGADVIGFNCGFGPAQILKFLPQLLSVCSVPVLIQSNAGLPQVINGNTVYTVEAEDFAENTVKVAQMGVQILGGCCGTTPAHIAAEVKACSGIDAALPGDKKFSLISSGSHALKISGRAAVSAVRTGEKDIPVIEKAMHDADVDAIVSAADDLLEESGMLFGISLRRIPAGDRAFIDAAAGEITEMSQRPCLIDFDDPAVLDRLLRRINGCPLLNLTGKTAEEIKAVFPSVKKYGAVMLLDPETLSRPFMDEAAAAGVPENRIAAGSLQGQFMDGPGFFTADLAQQA